MEQDQKRGRKVIEAERAKKELLHKQAIELVTEFSQCAPVRNAMWAVDKLGLKKCKKLAASNLTNYTFRKAVAQSV
jgi:hypothetical protein